MGKSQMKLPKSAADHLGQRKTKVPPHLEVMRVEWRNHLKEVYVSGQTLKLPRSACITEGDRLNIGSGGISVLCKNGIAQITPPYFALEQVTVGAIELELAIKEITEADEFEAYQALTHYHYRGHMLHGRNARLIVRNFHPSYPQVIGYIELATPFFMNKARSTVLDAPFRIGEISWTTWNKSSLRRYIHLFVRIARCVVYPEFRGLGLGQLLVQHGAAFARDHWQIAGLKPYFIEISADMLKYVPFAEKAGMHFVGETEGNLSRVAKDMAYLLQNQKRVKDGDIVKEEACGIVDKQVSRMSRAATLMQSENWSVDELVRRLKKLNHRMSLNSSELFQGIVSLPKPTYIQGLLPEVDSFIRLRVAEIKPENGHSVPPRVAQPIESQIIARGVSVTYQTTVRRTRRSHAIQQAFGISPKEFAHPVIKNLDLTLEPGDVLLITGSSGAGKTTLLRLFMDKGLQGLSGEVVWPSNYVPGMFRPIRSNRSLIEMFGANGVKSALNLMGEVGLSDAFVYLKRFDELSNGQQYRAMLARLIDSGCNVWIADEFCANLDPVTANVVAANLQQMARRLGVVLVVASSQPESVLQSLKPNKVLYLTTAWEHKLLTGEAYTKSFAKDANSHAAPRVRLAHRELMILKRTGEASIIQKGRQDIAPGLAIVSTGDELVPIRISIVHCFQFGTITRRESKLAGYKFLGSLRRALRKKYAGTRNNTSFTLLRLETLLTPAL
jgi:ABC-type transport system involved in cytochrome c biogenesis ATPase subunit/GNAT superfamily N-acetyltransferase